MYEELVMDKNINIIKFQFDSIGTLVGVLNFNDKFILIDTGTQECAEKFILPWFNNHHISLDKIYMIINTHTHGDHIGGNFILKQLNNNILLVTNKEGSEKIEDPYKFGRKIREKYADLIPVILPGELKGTKADIILEDNSVLEVDNNKIQAICTPGHDTDAICLYLPEIKVLFSGDSIQGGGTPGTGIAFYQDVDAYRDSLNKIMNLEINSLVLGHFFYPSDGIIEGREIVKEFIKLSLKYIDIYDREIKKLISDGKYNLLDTTKKLIEKEGSYKNPSLMVLAMHTVDSHMRKIRNSETDINTIK
jgi:glyoxylase-like metal-dependent hydrolase (beta-lactamase superfamily II)